MNFFHREILSFHAAALILGGAALVSKLLGLLRDRLLAATFGAGDILDAYYAAFQLPDVLYTLFLVGAASAAVLPVLVEYERRGQPAAQAFVSNLLTIFAAGAGAVALAAIVVSPWLVQLIVPGFGPAKLALATELTRLMMLNAVLLGIAGILSSVLQVRHRFLVFALPPIFYNLGIILGILVFVPLAGPRGLAYGVLAGGALQVLVQLPTFVHLKFRISPAFNLREPGILRVIRAAGPRVAALGMSQFTLVVLAAVSSTFAAGSLAVFKLAANLLYVPVGLFGVSYAQAMFPKLSGASLEGRGETFRESFQLGIRNILFWVLPFVTLFVVLRAHLVRVALGAGAFDWEDTRLVAAVLAAIALAIASESVLPLILRAFYALGRTREPFWWDVVGSVGTIGLALGFAAWFRASPEVLAAIATVFRIGDLSAPTILAVAFAFAIGSLANVMLLARALAKVSRSKFGVPLTFGFAAITPMLGAAVLAGLAAYGALLPFPALLATNTFWGIFLQGAVAFTVGLSVYGAALGLVQNPEINAIYQSFRERLMSPAKIPGVYETEKLDGDGR